MPIPSWRCYFTRWTWGSHLSHSNDWEVVLRRLFDLYSQKSCPHTGTPLLWSSTELIVHVLFCFYLVFESPVRSGLLPIFRRTETETGPPLFKIVKRPDWTTIDRSFAVLRLVLVLTGLKQFKTGLLPKILKIWLGRFIKIYFSFKMSPRSLVLVENWWSYKNIWVHIQFSVVFYRFGHIFVSFWPIIMFLGLFWRDL